MKISLPSEFPNAPPHGGTVQRLRNYWGGRRGLFALGAAAVAAGLGLNWGWLTAIGVTPVLVALLPCAAMCALGLCLPGMMKKSSGAPQAAKDITLQATAIASASRLQLASTGFLLEQTSIDRQPAVESVSVEQGCCRTSEAKENLHAKEN